jgi:hypothetical protein
VSNPSSQHFYEPLHWKVPGRGKVHRSHFVILRGPEVADYLKPSYYYGGISLAQRIYERTYASERTANEAPQVAMSKRLNIRKVNLEQVAANPAAFEEAMTELVQYRDNFGVHVIDTQEEFEQYDSALTDFDATIMTQYQLVASIANTPATKLLGTTPKGFNATGEHEIETYHEELESIQENELTDIIEGHLVCTMRSDIEPKFGKRFDVDVAWNPLKVESRQEKADINLKKAQTYEILANNIGAIEGAEVRKTLINDPESGFDGLEMFDEMSDPGLLDDVLNENQEPDSGDTPSQQTEGSIDPNSSLNGAQVTAIMDIIDKVRSGQMRKETATNVMTASFPMSEQQAKTILRFVEEQPQEGEEQDG